MKTIARSGLLSLGNQIRLVPLGPASSLLVLLIANASLVALTLLAVLALVAAIYLALAGALLQTWIRPRGLPLGA